MLLAIFGFIAVSCNNRDDDPVVQDNDTYSVMTDLKGSLNAGNSYALNQGININSTDVVLVYRKVSNVWQQIPKTLYLPNAAGLPTGREFDYNFVFDSQTVQVRIDDANFNLSTEISSSEVSGYLANQTFRIVLVPASQGKNSNVDYSDYNSVIKFYNIPDRK